MTDTSFEIVGAHAVENQTVTVKKKWFQGKPVVSIVLLGMVLLGCLFAEAIMTKDPTYMDLLHYNKAPGREFLFGTDTRGLVIFP